MTILPMSARIRPDQQEYPRQALRIESGRSMVELRTIADPASVLTGARTAESLDPDLPMIDVRTMKGQVRSTLADDRALAQLAVGFS